MKKITLIFCSLLVTQSLLAQVGLTNGFQSLHAPVWEKAIETGYDLGNANVFKSQVYASFDRAFQSKKKGMQLVPELGFSRQEISIQYQDDENPFLGASGLVTDTYRGTFISLMLNGDFFILRFKEPLKDSPLLGEGNWIKEGLFLRFGVGVTQLAQNRISGNVLFGTSSLGNEKDSTSGSLRAGAGIKLNISHFFTITPMVLVTHSTESTWNGLGGKLEYLIDPTFGFETYMVDPDYRSPVSNFLQIMGGIRFEMSFKKLGMVTRQK